ncbi:MAG TPA: MFS transporter [Chloroflexota bacterium]|nr:MFS transporter [Chloroflexota bacterium]
MSSDLAPVLRLPGFWSYAASRAASGIALTLLQAVILWQVYALSNSTVSLAIVGLVGFVSALCSSFVGGAVVDAYDHRVVLFASQLIPALASVTMLAAIATNHVTLELIYAIVLLTGLASSFEYPARQAMLPAIVPRHLFTRALTVNSALNSVTAVSGPALAGVLIAIGGIGQAYVVHAVLVAVAIVSLVPLHVPTSRSSGRLEMSAIRAGLGFVFQRPVLLGAMTLDMFAVMFGGARALLPVYAVDVLHADALGYGILSASLEAGTLVMALALVVLPHPTRTGRLLLLSVAAFGLATILFGVSTSLPLSVACYALVGMADQISMVMRQNTIQLNTPDALRGRVTAVNSVSISASNELGAFESGLVASATNAVFAVVSGGLACLVVVAVVAWRIPALRRHETVHQTTESEPISASA